MPALPITANYQRTGDDWNVTVHTDHESRQAVAPGLIAARVQADLLVDEIAGSRKDRSVVHLLDGDAYRFSVAYLHMRHGLALPG
ncbi:hypothetical protein [Actinosynnema sp. NPDC020468]|uniref:hypothetical protein n=1 Tax=Actinosynnema sp. NPDC020468 TaxID=3154488 RepID=UPI0033F70BD1